MKLIKLPILILAAISLLLSNPADARRIITPQEGRVAEITEVVQWYSGMYDYVMSNYEPDSLQHRFFKEVQNPKAWVLHSEWGPSLKLDEIEYCIRISKMTIQELLEEYNDLNPDHFVHQYIGQTLTQLEGLYFREHLLGRTIGRINSYDDALESMPEFLADNSFFEEEALLAKKKILLFREWAYRHWDGKPKIVSSLLFNLSSQDDEIYIAPQDFPKISHEIRGLMQWITQPMLFFKHGGVAEETLANLWVIFEKFDTEASEVNINERLKEFYSQFSETRIEEIRNDIRSQITEKFYVWGGEHDREELLNEFSTLARVIRLYAGYYVGAEAIRKSHVKLSEALTSSWFFVKDNIREIVTRDFQAGDVSIDVDEVALFQVMRNLLDNALQATAPDRENRITIRTYLSQDSKSVFIEVEDQGIGMSEEDLSRVFTEGFTTKSDGNGIGLALVKNLIESRCGGTIEVRSKFGEGTTFVIKLPVEQELEIAEAIDMDSQLEIVAVFPEVSPEAAIKTTSVEDGLRANLGGRSRISGLDLGSGIGISMEMFEDDVLASISSEIDYLGLELKASYVKAAKEDGLNIEEMDIINYFYSHLEAYGEYGNRDIVTIFHPYPRTLWDFVTIAKMLVAKDGLILVVFQKEEWDALFRGEEIEGLNAEAISDIMWGFQLVEFQEEEHFWPNNKYAFVYSPQGVSVPLRGPDK